MLRVLQKLLTLLACSGVGGCALPYYWQAGGGQLDLMRRRVPIEAAVADESLDQSTRDRLATVAELRRFASAELGLPDNGSYSSFVDLGRDYVVWNVIAAEAFSVDPVQWCFPVAGCVSYRGYFDRENAGRFERKLAAEGYDTWSGGSGAYSTLGYFSDPVINTMIGGSDADLARILFHELAHQRLYIKGDSELSEAFASAIEEYGVEQLLVRRGDTAALEAYRERRVRGVLLAELVERQREHLRDIYGADFEQAELLRRKAATFESMRREYEALKQEWGGHGDFDGWFEGDMNNARLAAISTYRKWLPGLRWRLDSIGPEAFFAEVEALGDLRDDARSAQLDAWNLESEASFSADLRKVIAGRIEIVADDRCQSLRLDAEMGEAVAAAYTGNAQGPQVVQREGLAGDQIIGDPGLNVTEGQRQADHLALQSQLAPDQIQQLTERIDVRPAQFERPADAVAVTERRNDCRGYVFHVDGGEPGVEPRQRQYR